MTESNRIFSILAEKYLACYFRVVVFAGLISFYPTGVFGDFSCTNPDTLAIRASMVRPIQRNFRRGSVREIISLIKERESFGIVEISFFNSLA